jgi:U3 small nucleolar RNA-associated protein 19
MLLPPGFADAVASAAAAAPPGADPANAAAGTDPYDPAQPDPALSRAVDSKLWEMEALRRHYCPQASRS